MAMSWELHRPGVGPAEQMHTVTEHWYLTENKTRVVREGDPAGRWLWASPGTQVPRRDAIRYGALVEEPEPEKPAIAELVEDGMDPEKVAEAVAENPIVLDEEPEKPAEEKKAKPAANKGRKPAANKAAEGE